MGGAGFGSILWLLPRASDTRVASAPYRRLLTRPAKAQRAAHLPQLRRLLCRFRADRNPTRKRGVFIGVSRIFDDADYVTRVSHRRLPPPTGAGKGAARCASEQKLH